MRCAGGGTRGCGCLRRWAPLPPKTKQAPRTRDRHGYLDYGAPPARGRRRRRRRLQDDDPAVPTVVLSVTFIEINAVGDVINVDDRFTNVEFVTGAAFRLESVSSGLVPGVPLADQPDLIPTTAVLFMIGLNADGEEVRGRFTLGYTNGCGDVLAWTRWVDVEDQDGEFCPANSGGTGAPTAEPGDSPNPTAAPTALPRRAHGAADRGHRTAHRGHRRAHGGAPAAHQPARHALPHRGPREPRPDGGADMGANMGANGGADRGPRHHRTTVPSADDVHVPAAVRVPVAPPGCRGRRRRRPAGALRGGHGQERQEGAAPRGGRRRRRRRQQERQEQEFEVARQQEQRG